MKKRKREAAGFAEWTAAPGEVRDEDETIANVDSTLSDRGSWR